MPHNLLTRAFAPSKHSPARWERRIVRFAVWFFPFGTGSILGIDTLNFLYDVSQVDPIHDLIAISLLLGMIAIIWVKTPWARQRPVALLASGIAGFGATVGVLALVTYYFVPQLHPSSIFVGGFGILILLIGSYYALLFRSTSQ